MQKNPETTQSVHFKKIGKWIISRVLYLIVLSHSVWSDMKLWAKIRSPASKGIICQNIQRVLKKISITDFDLIIIKQKYIHERKARNKTGGGPMKKPQNFGSGDIQQKCTNERLLKTLRRL